MNEQANDYSTEVFENALKTLYYAKSLYSGRFYNEAIDSSYQSVFDVMKSVLVLESFDFSISNYMVFSYFDDKYIITGIFPGELGHKLGKLKYMHEMCNPEYGYYATPRDAKEQMMTAESFILYGMNYLQKAVR